MAGGAILAAAPGVQEAIVSDGTRVVASNSNLLAV